MASGAKFKSKSLVVVEGIPVVAGRICGEVIGINGKVTVGLDEYGRKRIYTHVDHDSSFAVEFNCNYNEAFGYKVPDARLNFAGVSGIIDGERGDRYVGFLAETTRDWKCAHTIVKTSAPVEELAREWAYKVLVASYADFPESCKAYMQQRDHDDANIELIRTYLRGDASRCGAGVGFDYVFESQLAGIRE